MATFRDKVELIFDVDDRPYRTAAARMKAQARKDGQTIRNALFGAAAVGAGAVGALKVFATFERGLSKVQQRTKLADKEIADLGESIKTMSANIPVSTSQLLENAAAVGQLGITSKDALLDYTEVVSKMGEATVLEGEAAAFALARISNLTDTATTEVENVASAIVALGNTHAVTEDVIADGAVNIAAAIGQYGATAAEVLALATATGAMGQEGAKAATAIGKAMGNLNVAVLKGGKQLEAFANIMGVDAVEAARLWEENSVDAFNQFIVGLHKGGEEAQLLAESVGLMDQRTNRVLIALAKKEEFLARALDISREAFDENTALAIEYEISMNNLQSRFEVLRNRLTLVANEMGKQLAPAAERIVSLLHDMFAPENIKRIASFLILLGRLTAGFIGAKLAIAGIRLAVIALTGAMRVQALVARAAWAATTLGLSLIIAYIPEIVSFFKDVLPAALRGSGKLVKALGLSFVQIGQLIITAWLSAFAMVAEKLDGLAQKIAPFAKTLGVDVPTGFSKGFTAAADNAQAQVGRIAADITGLKDSAVEDFKTIGTAAGDALKQAAKDAFPQYDENFVIPGADADDPDSVNTGGGETELTRAQQQAADRRKKEIRKMGDFELAAKKAAAEEQRRAIEAANAEEERLLKEKNDRELAELQRKIDLETELRRMAQEGKTAQELAFYEQEQELAAEREELKRIEDAERRALELELNAQQLAALAKQREDFYKQQQAAARHNAQRQTADLINSLADRGSKAAKMVAMAARAQALIYLAGQAPVDASAAFGNAMRHIPAPFNLVAAPAAAAAVMAKAVAAVAQAKEVQIPGMKEGGMIGGGFALGDSQLRMVKPGEAMIPDKKWSAVENAIGQAMARGDYGRDRDRTNEGGGRHVEVDVRFKGNTGRLLEAELAAQDALGY